MKKVLIGLFLIFLTIGENSLILEYNLDKNHDDLYLQSLTYFKNEVKTFINKMWQIVEDIPYKNEIINHFPYVEKYFPKYYEEIIYISKLLKLPLKKIWLYQYSLEMYFYCTSIVVKLSNNTIAHGRDLDYSFKEMGEMSYIAVYKRNGKEIFRCTQYPAFTGVSTCMKKGAFGITMNARNGTDNSSQLDNLKSLREGKPLVCWFVRMAIEESSSYEELKNYIIKNDLTTPSYFIISGIHYNEGIVITKDRNKTIDTWELSEFEWFLIQDNDEHWKPVPANHKDRRTLAQSRIKAIGYNNINAKRLQNEVLNLYPNCNEFTLLTVSFIPENGYFNVNIL